MKGIQNLRVDYSGHLIKIDKMKNNPIEEFKLWFEDAKNNNIVEPNAMIFSTLSNKGLINSRTVLLKNIKDDGFIFFTNYESKKAIPNSIEFWQGRASRMHERIIYKKTENKWIKMRLYP